MVTLQPFVSETVDTTGLYSGEWMIADWLGNTGVFEWKLTGTSLGGAGSAIDSVVYYDILFQVKNCGSCEWYTAMTDSRNDSITAFSTLVRDTIDFANPIYRAPFARIGIDNFSKGDSIKVAYPTMTFTATVKLERTTTP